MAENLHDDHACDEYNRLRRMGRRDLLRVGTLSLFGLGMTEYFAMGAASAKGMDGGTATSAVLVWMGGGPSHLDLWDLKPNAPKEIRGAFNPIDTNVKGVQIGEHLPTMAKQMDKVALIRSMTTPEGAHERGTHYMMTGFQPLPGFGVPSYGSVAAKMLPPLSALPPYIAIPSPVMYGGAGFLGAALDPFSPGGDPNDGNFRVQDMTPPDGMTVERVNRRRALRDAVDSAFSRFEKGSDRVHTVDSFYKRAYALLSSDKAREAFALNKEPDPMRDAYGRNSFGQGMLLARRLVEGGVRFVTVQIGGWDTHVNAFSSLQGTLPSFDQGLAAFLKDMGDRGLLKKTLVIVMGEFGRTPMINHDGGRDHHPRCFSVLLAGGGIKGGTVIGASDARGYEPAEHPVRPEDLSATLYNCLGIDYTQSISSPEGVRVTLSRGGRPVEQALV